MSRLLRPPEWTRRGSCVGTVTARRDLFHPDEDDQERAWLLARPICAACPVRLACALEALTNGLPHGLYGGLTPADRRQVAREYGFPMPGAAEHGTRSRFVAGCTAGPDGRSCDPCRAAHAAYERERREVRRAERAALAKALPTLPPAEQVLATVRLLQRPVTAREMWRRTGVKARIVRALLDEAAADRVITPARRRMVS